KTRNRTSPASQVPKSRHIRLHCASLPEFFIAHAEILPITTRRCRIRNCTMQRRIRRCNLKKPLARVLLVFGVLASGALATLAVQLTPQKAPDAVEAAQKPSPTTPARPEERKTDHDQSAVFSSVRAEPNSTAVDSQPKAGKITGFDFYRDPL